MLSERGRHYEKLFNKTFAWRVLAAALRFSRAGADGRSGIYWVKLTICVQRVLGASAFFHICLHYDRARIIVVYAARRREAAYISTLASRPTSLV